MPRLTDIMPVPMEEWMKDIIKIENHHNHEIVISESGTYRWKPNPDVELLLERISLNDLIPLLIFMGYDKNSEVYRKLYRDMGYSLYGYWEVFYWDGNNEKAHKYRTGFIGFIKRLLRI